MCSSKIMARLPTDCVRSTISSSVGSLTLVASAEGLHMLLFEGQAGACIEYLQNFPLNSNHPVFMRVESQMAEFFAHERHVFDLPLAMAGTVFQKRVWDLLLEIPYGRTASYGQLARKLGGVGLSRAVGAAIGLNPIGIIVPCHRVVGQDGALTGFAGGLDIKRCLLDLELDAKLGAIPALPTTLSAEKQRAMVSGPTRDSASASTHIQ